MGEYPSQITFEFQKYFKFKALATQNNPGDEDVVIKLFALRWTDWSATERIKQERDFSASKFWNDMFITTNFGRLMEYQILYTYSNPDLLTD